MSQSVTRKLIKDTSVLLGTVKTCRLILGNWLVLFSVKFVVLVRKVGSVYSLHQTELAMNCGQVQVADVDVIFITKGVQCWYTRHIHSGFCFIFVLGILYWRNRQYYTFLCKGEKLGPLKQITVCILWYVYVATFSKLNIVSLYWPCTLLNLNNIGNTYTNFKCHVRTLLIKLPFVTYIL